MVVWVLLLLASTEFVVRGPVRYPPPNWNDLAQYYATSRIWLRGQNFANPQNFSAMWQEEVGETWNPNSVRLRVAPPIGALVLFAPIAALPWPAAKLVWLAVLLISFAATIVCLLEVAGFSFADPRALAFMAGCLALAPFHTGIATGNQTILVVGLSAIGIWAAGGERDIIAGMSFGAACSLKPHVAGFLLLYYLLRQRWRLFITAVTFAAVLVFIAAAWMRIAGVSWFPDYVSNIQFGAARNRVDDFTTANPIRFMLINLQVPLFSFTHTARSANALAFSVGAVQVVIWMVLVIRSRYSRSDLLGLAAVAVIGLLPVYHRLYDASVLAIPLCWCVSRANSLRNVRNGALVLMAPFLVPGAALLQEALRLGRIPQTWATSWWWDRFLMPHQTWFLLLLSIVLLYGMAKQSSRGMESPQERVR